MTKRTRRRRRRRRTNAVFFVFSFGRVLKIWKLWSVRSVTFFQQGLLNPCTETPEKRCPYASEVFPEVLASFQKMGSVRKTLNKWQSKSISAKSTYQFSYYWTQDRIFVSSVRVWKSSRNEMQQDFVNTVTCNRDRSSLRFSRCDFFSLARE